ncbi:MAG: hypothetical protein QXI12_08525 [Candidatus Methanomethyliaceae archaeon]
MNEWREEVLKAEAAILALAEELARAKGITESVSAVERRLNAAAIAVEKSRNALEEALSAVQRTSAEAQIALNSSIGVFRRASDQLSESFQALSSQITQAITDVKECVCQTLQEGHQNVQHQLKAATEEVHNMFVHVANSLVQLREDFERNVGVLVQQNEKMMQRMAVQNTETERLSKRLLYCLIFAIASAATSFVIFVLLLSQRT